MNSASWKKCEDENGFNYYINLVTNLRQWDHPKFSEIKQKLDDCNYIKYVGYRVASKLRVLQRVLHMDEIPLPIITGVFERHRLGATESTLHLESYDLEAVLSDIYFAANNQNHLYTDIDFATELMINFLYNVFDRDRKNNIQVVSTKLVLALLCNSKLKDTYGYIFQLCSDHNNCITRFRLQGLLKKISDFMNYLRENNKFGNGSITAAVESCFKNSPGLIGMNEMNFINWMESGPDFFSWIPILHRLKFSETVIHSAKCSVCHATPIIGLRYRCLKCSRYIQCQQCFFTGRINNPHKLTHRMKEYFSETSTKDLYFGLLRKICGNVKCKNQDRFSKIVDIKPLSTDQNVVFSTNPTEVICNVEPLSSPMAQLQVIIRQLEIQNRELQQIIIIGNKAEDELNTYLEEHRLQVASQINKLKILKDYLKPSAPSYVSTSKNLRQSKIPSCPDFFSTPMIDKTPKLNANFSPITFKNNLTKVEEDTEQISNIADNVTSKNDLITDFSLTNSFTMADISSWIGVPLGLNSLEKSIECKPKMHEGISSENGQNDLDEALAKLQQILANNFVLDESLDSVDNGQLKSAVTEVEGMLTTIIDNVECNEITKFKNYNKKNKMADKFFCTE